MKKYELVENLYDFFLDDDLESHKCYKIRALCDFGNVHKGDLGGYVENESNLSHTGDCWVYEGAVYGGALIRDNAKVTGNAYISGGAVIRDNARVDDGFVNEDIVIGGDDEIFLGQVERYNKNSPRYVEYNKSEETITELADRIKSLPHEDFIELMKLIFNDEI